MKVTFFGTTTLLFDDGRDQILSDCHFTRPSMLRYLFGKAKTNTALADEIIRNYHIDRLRAIFISHSHYDHVMDAPYIANKCGAVLYGSGSTVNVGRGGGVSKEQLVEFHPDEQYRIGNYRVKVLASKHSEPTAWNNDLGQTIEEPLVQPARLRDYKEGGSHDFYVEAENKKNLIRPSCNYIEGQLDDYPADVLFLGITGLSGMKGQTRQTFFEETIGKVKPYLVVPIHWDNFFLGLDRPIRTMPRVYENTEKGFNMLKQYCQGKNIDCQIQIPMTSIEF